LSSTKFMGLLLGLGLFGQSGSVHIVRKGLVV
jgi:hypothetical protein